jgi:hypothetical protein
MQGYEFIGTGKVAILTGKFGDIEILCRLKESLDVHLAISRKYKDIRELHPEHKFILLDTDNCHVAKDMLRAMHPLADIRVIQLAGLGLEKVEGYRNYQAFQEAALIDFVNN